MKIVLVHIAVKNSHMAINATNLFRHFNFNLFKQPNFNFNFNFKPRHNQFIKH
jgi:hypothetical protein